jgi:hypothetical protein
MKEEGLQCLSFPMPCWHFNEKISPPTNVNIQKPPQLKGKTCPLRTDHNKNHPSHEPQLLSQPHKKRKLMKPNQLELGRQ